MSERARITQWSDNADMNRIAAAFKACGDAPVHTVGDDIDRGLILLRELEARGYALYRLPTPDNEEPSPQETT
jgi:hypothetical protein